MADQKPGSSFMRGLGLKDYVMIAGFIFTAGGMWFRVESMDSRLKKLEQYNPELIEYRLNELDKDIGEILSLVKELKND